MTSPGITGDMEVKRFHRRVLAPVFRAVRPRSWRSLIWSRHWLGLIPPLCLFGAWEWSTRTNNSGVLPSPTAVVTAFHQWISARPKTSVDPFSGTLGISVEASLERVAAGFAIAAIIGVVVGLVIGRSRRVEALLDPTLQTLRPIPFVAWVPFVLVFIGLGFEGPVALVAAAAFFPVLVNTTAGAQHTPKELVRAARMLGASEIYILRRVIIPAALPSIFTGFRVGAGLAWVGVIVAELVGVKTGLGFILWQSYYWARIDMLVASIIVIGLLGFVTDRIFYFYSRRRFFWTTE